MKKAYRYLTILSLAFLHLSAYSNIVIDSGFDTGFTGTWDSQTRWAGSNLNNGTGVAADNAFIYDAGWVVYDLNGDLWTVSDGQAVRTATTSSDRFNAGGFGQMVTNPGTGFSNGDQVTFSFDYEFDPVNNTNVFLSGSVYGIKALNGTATNWNLFGGDSVEDLGSTPGSSGPSINQSYSGTNYELVLLDNYTLTAEPTPNSNTYISGTINIDDDYDLFAFVFQGASKDSTGANVAAIDNVSLVSIPEPHTQALLSGLFALGLMLVGRLKRKSALAAASCRCAWD